jgi:hypothetical protein
MQALKAGRIGDLGDSMAGDMDAAMVAEWNRVKDTPLPTDPAIVRDRQILFVAVARGILHYLERRESWIETTASTAGGGATEHSHQLQFEWE